MRHRIPNNGCSIHYRRNPDSNYAYSQSLLIQSGSVISHAGTGTDSCIRYLNGSVQPFNASGRQSVDSNNNVRSCLLRYTSHNFQGFHTRLPHDSRNQTADTVEFLLPCALHAIFPDNMSGNMQIGYHIRPQRVRRNISVSQPHHQNIQFLFFREQSLHMFCQFF